MLKTNYVNKTTSWKNQTTSINFQLFSNTNKKSLKKREVFRTSLFSS